LDHSNSHCSFKRLNVQDARLTIEVAKFVIFVITVPQPRSWYCRGKFPPAPWPARRLQAPHRPPLFAQRVGPA